MLPEMTEECVIHSAVAAVMAFCKKYGDCRIEELSAIVAFTIAFREGGVFEWVTHNDTFTCLSVVPPRVDEQVVTVLKNGMIDEKLTVEINVDLYLATQGELGVAR